MVTIDGVFRSGDFGGGCSNGGEGGGGKVIGTPARLLGYDSGVSGFGIWLDPFTLGLDFTPPPDNLVCITA